MKRKALALALLAFLPAALRAQVYSWEEPRTGGTRISTVAPAWYRFPYVEHVAGPRVVVSIGATVIDDTALPLAKRLELFERRHPKPAARR